MNIQISGFIFIFVTLFCTVLGQIAIKSGVVQVVGNTGGVVSNWALLLGALSNTRVIFGLGMAVVAACGWILALSRLPLSYAYPFLSVTFPIVVIASSIVFDESVSPRAYLGLALIVGGLVIASSTSN